MDIATEIRDLIEALHNQNLQFQKLLTIILQLGKDQDKDAVISAFRSVNSEPPIEKDDHVIFGSLALRFNHEGHLVDLFRIVRGTTTRAEVLIGRGSDN